MGIRKKLDNKRNSRKIEVKNWKGSLRGIPAFIIGNAPSLLNHPVKSLEPYFTIGINKAYRVIDPTILMWQDLEFWVTDRYGLANTKCVKFCRHIADPISKFHHFKLKNGSFSTPTAMDMLHGTGASGPLAFQTAYLMGCDPIVILGMDCKYSENGKTNFYGMNKYHKQHTLRNCSRGLKWIEDSKDKLGVEIINCSDSDYLNDNKMPLQEAIDYCKDKYPETGREFFKKRMFNK